MPNRVIFYDCEFQERGNKYPIMPISIGMVDENGRTFYACNREMDFTVLSDWVKVNVMPHLTGDKDEWVRFMLNPLNAKISPVWKTMAEIKQGILDFVGNDRPIWCAWYASYDHTVLSQIFGTMIDLPRGWPMWTFDLKQLAADYGDPRMPGVDDNLHNSLGDAQRLKENAAWLKQYIKANPDKYKPLIF